MTGKKNATRRSTGKRKSGKISLKKETLKDLDAKGRKSLKGGYLVLAKTGLCGGQPGTLSAGCDTYGCFIR
jgi:hypothetical protein